MSNNPPTGEAMADRESVLWEYRRQSSTAEWFDTDAMADAMLAYEAEIMRLRIANTDALADVAKLRKEVRMLGDVICDKDAELTAVLADRSHEGLEAEADALREQLMLQREANAALTAVEWYVVQHDGHRWRAKDQADAVRCAASYDLEFPRYAPHRVECIPLGYAPAV